MLLLVTGDYERGWRGVRMALASQGLRAAGLSAAALGRLAARRPDDPAAPRAGTGRHAPVRPLCPAGQGTRRHRPLPLSEAAAGDPARPVPASTSWCRGTTLPPHFDVHAPLLSLPRLFGTTVGHDSGSGALPRRRPARSSNSGAAAWRPVPGFKVGIAWQGDPKYIRDRQRSVPLTQFEPLARVPGVRLISLQKGPGAEQAAALAGRFPLLDWGPELDEAAGPFMDTAALLTCLDLVITVDTALVHLAGTMGVRTWLAQRFMPHWPWLLDREDSPWYPTVRLFRQPRPGSVERGVHPHDQSFVICQ